MKLKATAHEGLPQKLLQALDAIRPTVIKQVLIPHLKVSPTIGPAEFFVQRSDMADAGTHDQPFIHVGLSGLSLNDERSANDFLRARDALVKIYKDLILGEEELVGRRVQLFVVLYLDGKHPKTNSNLVESDPEWIQVPAKKEVSRGAPDSD